MAQHDSIKVQVLVFGGGVAGLWIANELWAAGHSVLVLESDALGTGQTIGSQGILHGGTKYALSGIFDRSAYAIRDMPDVWRRCLAGRPNAGQPDVSATRIRADYCHIWRTESRSSRLAQLGARLFLRTTPSRLDAGDWPVALRQCPGAVDRLDEQVIAPASLMQALRAPINGTVLHYDGDRLEAARDESGVQSVTIQSPDGNRSLRVEPAFIVLASGAGNESLLKMFGLRADNMQARPLHMVMVRGDLPNLNGHCVDGRSTRVTITTDQDSAGRTIWQVGGQVAERGINMRELELIRHAHDELCTVLPGVDFSRAEWATYKATRAEGRTATGRRPEGPVVHVNGNVLSCWPTKLVLAPRLATEVRAALSTLTPVAGESTPAILADWPRPDVASPPWETASSWTRIP